MKHPAFAAYVAHVGGPREAARRLGVTTGMIYHILSGIRGVSTTLAIKIESDTNGLIPRALLRPDLWGGMVARQ